MEEMILFNEMKMPVGASSERLMSESLRRFFNWQIHQMFMDGLWLNWFIQNTESFSNESDGCFEMRCGSAKNISDLILLYLLIEPFIKLLNSHNGENVEWCCLTNCILNIKTFHFGFLPQYAEFLSVACFDFSWRSAWTSPQQRNLIPSIDALYTEAISTSGATDHKTHGSDHTTDFESRIGSFFGSAKKSCVNY